MKSASNPLIYVLSSQVGSAAKATRPLCKASARLLPDHEALTTLAPRGGRNFYSKLISRARSDTNALSHISPKTKRLWANDSRPMLRVCARSFSNWSRE